MARQRNQTGLCFSAGRMRADGRLRRAEAGTVTEMARSLLRDAREAGGGEAMRGHLADRMDRIEPARAVEPVPRAA